MSKRSRTVVVALAVCGVLGLVEAAFLVDFGGSGAGMVGNVLLWMGLGFMLAMAQFAPYAVIVLGVLKLRKQQGEAAEALGDENVVNFDPDGERKLHEYLSAMNSTEAFLGMVPRSATYLPPEMRQPVTTPRSRKRRPPKYSWLTWLLGTIFAGAVSGASLVLVQSERSDPAELVQWMIFIGAFCAAFVSPLGLLLGLIFGRTVRVLPNDAGTSDPEAA